jgi:hypothetical protein
LAIHDVFAADYHCRQLFDSHTPRISDALLCLEQVPLDACAFRAIQDLLRSCCGLLRVGRKQARKLLLEALLFIQLN